MKSKKKIYNANIDVFVYCNVFNGCTKNIEDSLGEGLLSTEDVERILEEEGLTLTKVWKQPFIRRDINRMPVSYDVGDGYNHLFIYSFDSIASRKEVFPTTYSSFGGEAEDIASFIITAKNIAIVYEYTPKKDYMFLTVSRDLSNAVFYRMNDIKEVMFQGSGDYWNVNLDLEYLEYEWEDNEGEEHLEYYGRYEIYMTFLGENPGEVSDLAFQYSRKENEWRGGRITNKEGGSVLKEGGIYSRNNTMDIPIEKKVIDFTIEWHGYEENITLMKEKHNESDGSND